MFRSPLLRALTLFVLSVSVSHGVFFIALSPILAEVPSGEVEGQPLGANVARIIKAMEYVGAPLPDELTAKLNAAIAKRDAKLLQTLLDQQVLLVVSLNPEVRVKVTRGPAKAKLQQGGFTPILVKVLNESTVTRQLKIISPQGGAVYSGAALGILKRQAQTELNENENRNNKSDRFLSLEMFQAPPMTTNLSGLEVEYAIALIYSSEKGKRESTIGFDVGEGTQDIGFRGETPVLFDIAPAIPVELTIRDDDGKPTIAKLTFRDSRGRVYPTQPKRLAPDLFFQPQIYRADGEVVLLPPGQFTVHYSRGPEYRMLQRNVTVTPDTHLQIQVQRWVKPMDYGFYCGDHHIHGAGCSHYTNPTEGVTPADMFRQVKGEGLNVGCVLTWGPCFDFQRRYFNPIADEISEPTTILKYDLEISGFGSAALGHVCLLNLKDQTYPGSAGSKDKGWPTWTVPVMRWCKEQGGVTGYPHSAMHVNPAAAAKRMLDKFDSDKNLSLSQNEIKGALLPAAFGKMDENRNGSIDLVEATRSIARAADQLPNYAVPEMNGAGAMEIFVSGAEGVCDFISAMDTARVPEWNTWYHLLNCGLPIRLSGETDFPCMSSRRVGQGRVYVQMGKVQQLDFGKWCEGVGQGRSYVSDGFAHALKFEVEGQSPGFANVDLEQADTVTVIAEVSFAPEIPKAVAYGMLIPASGRRMVGDTVNLHAPRTEETVKGGVRLVEIVQNGLVVAKQEVPADGKTHRLEFQVPVAASSWLALRQFPQLHTNVVNVIVNDKPIRASRKSAQWCEESIKLLWTNRNSRISQPERKQAEATYQKAIRFYQKIASESE